MPTSSTICTNLRSSLERLRSLKTDFDAVYESDVFSGTTTEIQKAQDLKQTLETHTRELQERVNTLEAEHVYDLRDQYESQVTFLKRTGMIETKTSTDETGKEKEVSFMKDIHGNDYPVPSYETIIHRFVEQKELLLTKADQGFTKFLLVPFGMSLDQMIQRFRTFLLDYKKAHPEFGRVDPARKDASDKSDWNPLWVWESGYTEADVKGTLVYDPQVFNKKNHNGLTKTEILEQQKTNEDTAVGWRLLFLQADKNGKGFKGIPRNGQGEIQGKQLPRQDVEAGKSPNEYLADQLTASTDPTSAYYGESGTTPEEWIVMFMTNLQETGKLLGDYSNDRDSLAYLTGAYFKASGSVSDVGWYRDDQLVGFGKNRSVGVYGDVGRHVAVRV